jgi:hypothetical protein
LLTRRASIIARLRRGGMEHIARAVIVAWRAVSVVLAGRPKAIAVADAKAPELAWAEATRAPPAMRR